MRRGQRPHAAAASRPLLLTRSPHVRPLVPPSGDDLRVGGPHPGLPERAQQASVALLPRGDAEEPEEAAGETSAGGAAEGGPAAQASGGDGEEEKEEEEDEDF